MNNHIDQLTEWWENAEVPTSATLPKDGDRIIIRYNSEWYEIATADGDADEHDLSSYTRILARASKPKPAWHDALSVMARCSHAPEGHREPFIRSEATHDVWIGEGGWARTEDLRDVTPLIEAKVTDEMVERGRDIGVKGKMPDPELVRRILTAALGIEEGP